MDWLKGQKERWVRRKLKLRVIGPNCERPENGLSCSIFVTLETYFVTSKLQHTICDQFSRHKDLDTPIFKVRDNKFFKISGRRFSNGAEPMERRANPTWTQTAPRLHGPSPRAPTKRNCEEELLPGRGGGGRGSGLGEIVQTLKHTHSTPLRMEFWSFFSSGDPYWNCTYLQLDSLNFWPFHFFKGSWEFRSSWDFNSFPSYFS